MAGRRGWVWPLVTWLLAVMVAAAAVGVRFPLAEAMDTDPRVGAGRLERRAVAPEPGPVLPTLPDPGPVRADAVAARLAAVPNDGGGDLVGVVLDGRSGAEVARLGAGVRTPASSMKLLSGLAALDVLGTDRTFATTVHRTDDGTLVLRGGGDPLLTSVTTDVLPVPASLDQLADATAAALARAGVTQVTLAYDATLFTGPAWHPEWPAIFAQSVAPVSALTVDHARVNPPGWERHPDPAAFAAERFAAALAARGVVAGPGGPLAMPAGADELARVESLPVRTLVEQSLLTSDNDAAETLLWHVALARGRPATPTDAAAVLAAELQRLGLWADGMAVHDGAGIAATNQVTPDALAGAVRLGLERPDLRALVSGLPVAAVSGTLAERFTAEDALAGRGVVRAKTGTIRGVNTLSGYLVSADGRPLVFAFLVSGGAGQTSARLWLDRATAALASCGC